MKGGRLEFRILGPLAVVDGNGRELPLGGHKPRLLLARLLLEANQPLSVDRLIDDLWGGSPPASAATMLHGYVSKLRKALAAAGRPDVLSTRHGGYLLAIEGDELDVVCFERLVEEGVRAIAANRPEEAARLLRRALSLWRGPPLADLAFEPAVQVDVRRLEQARLSAIERRIDAELAAGRDGDLVPELESLVANHPFEERLHRQLMVALDRADRPAEALAVYQALRRRFATELGLEPSPELSELQLKILKRERPPAPARDAAGNAPAAPARARSALGRPLRARHALLAALLLVAIGAGAWALASRDGAAGGAVAPNSVAVIDPASNRVLYSIPVGDAPIGPATDGETVWTTSGHGRTLSKLPGSRGGRTLTVGTGIFPSGIAVAAGSVWVSNWSSASVLRIDGRFGSVEGKLPLGGRGGSPSVLASGEGAVWLARRFERLRKIDPRTDAVVRTYPVVTRGEALAVGFGAAWVGAALPNRLVRVDVDSGRVSAVPLVYTPQGVAVGAGSVWVIVAGDDKVWRIDPGTNAVTSTIPVGGEPSGIAFDGDEVWVSSASSGTVSRIDPKRERVVATIKIGHAPSGIAVARGRVWVAVRPSPSERAPSSRSTHLLATIETGQDAGITTGAGAVWVAEHREGTLARIDPETNKIVTRIDVGSYPTNPVYGAGSLWLPLYAGYSLSRIDPTTNRIITSIPGLSYNVAVGYGSVWALTWRTPYAWVYWKGRTLARIEPRTNRVVARIHLPATLSSVAVGGGSVWVSGCARRRCSVRWETSAGSAPRLDRGRPGSIWRIDPQTGHVLARIRLARPAGRLAFGYGSLWATAQGARLLRIDPRTNRVIASLRTSSGGPINYDYLALGEGAVWVVNLNDIVDSALVKVDPATNRVEATVALPKGPQGVATGFGSVWVSFFDSAKVLRFAP